MVEIPSHSPLLSMETTYMCTLQDVAERQPNTVQFPGKTLLLLLILVWANSKFYPHYQILAQSHSLRCDGPKSPPLYTRILTCLGSGKVHAHANTPKLPSHVP